MDEHTRDQQISEVKKVFIYGISRARLEGITVSRSVHNRDIVPHVLPESFGFLHPGVETWGKSDSDIEICTADIESNSCFDSIVSFTSIQDHRTYYNLSEATCV